MVELGSFMMKLCILDELFVRSILKYMVVYLWLVIFFMALVC